jgi:hypothetical protein
LSAILVAQAIYSVSEAVAPRHRGLFLHSLPQLLNTGHDGDVCLNPLEHKVFPKLGVASR